jgi:hypothetical protein
MDLRLLHHYFSSTCHTFAAIQDQSVFDTWSIYASAMAFDHNYLLQGILAVSALHLSYLHPSQKEYSHAHPVYLNAAAQEHRKAVANLGRQNADAVCLTAILISYQAFALLQGEDLAEYTPPIQWLQTSHAIKSIIRETRRWIDENSRTYALIYSIPQLFDLSSLLHVPNSTVLPAVLTWSPEGDDELIPSEDALVYQQLTSLLGTIAAAIDEKELPSMISRRFMSLGAIMPDRFMHLLSQHDPRALVILAHFFAMTKQVDDLWWFRGVARREVLGIRSILPANWYPLMEWPLRVLEGNEIAKSA